MPIPGFTAYCDRPRSKSILKNTTWILTNMGSPNVTLPLNNFRNPQNPRRSRKSKSLTLVIRLTINPCPSSAHSTRGIHSSHFRWILVDINCLAFRELISCHDFFPSITVDPLFMQPGLTSRLSCSSPMLVAPAPQIAPDYNVGNFLSPLRASPIISSGYSSPMASTPALTPERELGFMGNAGMQLGPCLGTTQHWTAGAWPDQGLLFIE
jgi:hypothetical protein